MWRRKTYSDRDQTIRVIFKRDFSSEKQQTNKQIARALKVGTETQRKKIIRYIKETIGKRNIELGRDTWG